MRIARGFGRFWWDFVVGEDWRIAAAVAAVLTAGALLVTQTELSDTAITLACGSATAISVILSIALPAIAPWRKPG